MAEHYHVNLHSSLAGDHSRLCMMLRLFLGVQSFFLIFAMGCAVHSLIYNVSKSLCQLGQCIPFNHHLHPLLHALRPDLLVELDTRFVPLEHAPLQPTSLDLQHLSRQILQQLKPISPTTSSGLHVEILQVDTRRRAPSRVVIEE